MKGKIIRHLEVLLLRNCGVSCERPPEPGESGSGGGGKRKNDLHSVKNRERQSCGRVEKGEICVNLEQLAFSKPI